MKWQYRLVSGKSPAECAVIGRRQLGDDPYAADEWLLVHRDVKRGVSKKVVHHFPWPQVTGLWRAPGGLVWVAAPGGVYAASSPYSPKKGIKSRNLSVHGPLVHGVWGLDDKTVFAWSAGKNMYGSYTGISRLDGRSWEEFGRPKVRRINALHGTNANNLVAVGVDGFATHWDGASWTPIDTGTTAEIIAVQVVSKNEVVAITHDAVLRGTMAKLETVCSRADLRALAVFAGQTWVGTSEALLRLEGDTLVEVDASLPAFGLAVGEDVLLVASGDDVVGIDARGNSTSEGGEFEALTEETPFTREPMLDGQVGPFVIERDDSLLGVPWSAPSLPNAPTVIQPADHKVYVDTSKPARAPGRDGHWLVSGSRDLASGREGVLFELDDAGNITMVVKATARQASRIDDDRWLLLGHYGVSLLCRRGEGGEVTDEIQRASDMPPCIHGALGVVPWGLGACRLVCAEGEALTFVVLPYPINGAGVSDDGDLVIWDDVERVAWRVRLNNAS